MRIVLNQEWGQILQFNITEQSTAVWTARQLLAVYGPDKLPRYSVRDRDAIYETESRRQADALDKENTMTAPRPPWQSIYAERPSALIRRECLDHMVILGEFHLRCSLASYAEYYHSVRTRLSLEKHMPYGRPIQSPDQGERAKLKRVGGLHHHYGRIAAYIRAICVC